MALHSRDTVTLSAAVATRSWADCSSMEDYTSLSTALVLESEPQGCIGRVEGGTNQGKKATERKGIM